MQESLDRLDEYISRALRAEAMTSLQHMPRAREELLRRAAQQTVLPPVAPAPDPVGLWEQAHLWLRASLAGMYHFIADDTVYRRVQQNYPTLMRHQRPHSTFASAEIMLAA